MRILFGSIVVAGSGKIGGHVASKNRGGTYMRTRVTPANPQSVDQTKSRNRLSSISSLWKTLDAATVAAWNAVVESWKGTNVFGNTITPSGFNLFQKLNNNLVRIAESEITDPPVPEEVPVIITGVLTATEATSIEVTFSTDPIITDSAIVVAATPAIPASQSFVKNKFCEIGLMPALETHVTDLTSLYEDRFGEVGEAGKKIFVKMQQIVKATGQAGIPVVYECVIGS
jgi:hypothetical protein